MATGNRRKLSIALYVIAIVCSFVCLFKGLVVLDISDKDVTRRYSNIHKALTDYSDGWFVVPEGKEQAIEAVTDQIAAAGENGAVTIEKNVDFDEINGQTLFFETGKVGVRVWADEELVFASNVSEISDTVRYVTFQTADLPEDKAFSKITVEFSGLENGQIKIPKIFISSRAGISFFVSQNEKYNTIIIIIMCVIGVMGVLGMVVMKLNDAFDRRLRSLMFFILLAIIWGLTDSYLSVLSNINVELVGLLCYLSLMNLPIPLLSFTRDTLHPDSKLMGLAQLITLLNVIIQNVLAIFGLISLEKMLIGSHALVAISILITIISLKTKRHEMKGNIEYRQYYAAIITLSVFAVAAIVLYWFIGGYLYHICLMTGFLVFIVFLLIIIFRKHLNDISKIRQSAFERELYEKLSYYDKLTGLRNRRALGNHVDDLLASEEKNDAILIIFDLNGLKFINDTFGHFAGDELLVSAANAIKETYKKYGESFRVGGDEFIAILTDNLDELTDISKMLKVKADEINENNEVKLSIAVGYSHLIKEDGEKKTYDEWLQEADVNMFNDKVKGRRDVKEQIENEYLDITKYLIAVVEKRDGYTANHSERVKEISMVIGDLLGISEPTRKKLEITAYVHDIGKIGINDAILLSDKPLTQEQYDVMKNHVNIGASLISKLDSTGELSNIVLSHHERFDGTGYPNGLKAKDIPFEARIISVADSIDAMMSKRSYKEAMTFDTCKAELNKNRGKMYDPAIVDIVLANWDKVVEIMLSVSKREIK